MTLDEPTWVEIARRQREEHWAQLEAEWRERCLVESEEATAASWARKMACQPEHMTRQVWD